MKYQVDQSIKIENTSKATFVSLANDKIIISSISAKAKRELKLFFRELEKPLIFKLFTFSVLCSKVLIKARNDLVTIDCEYTKHEIDIKSYIVQIFRIEGLDVPNICFSRLGKRSSAHTAGYNAMKNNNKGIAVTVKDVLYYYDKINRS